MARQRHRVDRTAGGASVSARPSEAESLPARRSILTWTDVGIALLALLVRLVYLHESSGNPTFATPIMDSADYDDLARALLDGHAPQTSLFWQPVFYPLFLAAVYKLTGASILAAKVIQAVVGALTCVLTQRLGRRVLGPRAGLLAGLITAVYGPLVFFEGELLATGWAAFWAVALVLLALVVGERRRPSLDWLLGGVAALSVITRPTFLPVVVVGAVWLAVVWVRRAYGWRRVGLGLAALVAGFLLIALPVGALNYRMHAHFGILPASGGINFYIGNNPEASATIAARPGRAWRDLLAMPTEQGVRGGVWEEQRFFYERARSFAAGHPVAFGAGLLSKAVEFVSAREVPRSVDLYTFRQWSRVLSILAWKIGGFGFPFGVLLPLALLGIVHAWRRIPGVVWLLLVCYPLAIILVFCAARYRAPLVPIIAVLAAGGLCGLAELASTRRWRHLGIEAGIAAMLALAISLPGPFPAERINSAAELHQFLANRLFKEERLPEAITQYQEALRFAPADADIHGKLAETLHREGDRAGAIEHYRAALQARPDSATNWALLGIALAETGALEDAVAAYREALRVDPKFARIHANLGGVLRELGRLDEAIAAYERSVQLAPREATLHYNLGAALAARGDIAAARAALERALSLDPGYEPARTLLRQLGE